MNTFLPFADFEKSVSVLDYRRLGKQRVEALQILNTLKGKSKGWINHPAVRMWRGYENALATYFNACVREWIKRGYNNNLKLLRVSDTFKMPPWFGKKKFHRSHRSNLLRKDAEHYKRYFPKVPDNLPYYWPEC